MHKWGKQAANLAVSECRADACLTPDNPDTFHVDACHPLHALLVYTIPLQTILILHPMPRIPS